MELLEKIQRHRIHSHVEKHGFNQVSHLYTPRGKSCFIKLIKLLEGVISMIHENRTGDVVYMSLVKLLTRPLMLGCTRRLWYMGSTVIA